MFSALTAGQLTRLRLQPPRFKWRVAIHRPRTLFVVTYASKPLPDQITYSGVVSGSAPGDPNLTMLVGTSAGDDSKGRVRVRSIDSGNSYIYIAETGTGAIDWQVGDTLTVIEQHYPWPKYPYFRDDGGIEMDHWEIYSDQHDEWPPQVIMGSSAVGYVGEPMYFVGERCLARASGATITDALWTFPDGTTSAVLGTTAVPASWTPATTYPDGRYAKLTITDSNGKTHTSWRLRWVFDPDDDEPGEPYVSIDSLSGGVREGGYEASLVWWDDSTNTRLSAAEIPVGAEVLVWEDVLWADGDDTPIGGNYPYQTRSLMRAWAIEETTALAPGRANLTTRIGTIDKLLSLQPNYPVYFENEADTVFNTWLAMDGMTADKVLWHYARWRHTLDEVCDVYGAESYAASEEVQFYSLDQGAVWEQLTSIYGEQGFGPLGLGASDLQSAVWFDLDANILDSDERSAYPQIAALTDADRMRETGISRPNFFQTAQVVLWGVDNATPKATRSPDDPFGYFGRPVERTRMIAPSQDTLNTWAGNWRARDNNRDRQVRLPLSRPFRIDAVPQSRIALTLANAKSGGRLAWSTKTFWVRGLAMRREGGTAFAELDLEADTTGLPGSTIPIEDPPAPCTDCYPIPECPPCPPCPSGQTRPTRTPGEACCPECVPAEAEGWASRVMLGINLDSVGSIRHTHDFSGPETVSQPTWDDVTANLPVAPFTRLIADPFDPHGRQWVMVDQNGGEIYGNAWSGVEVYDWAMILDADEAAQVIIDAHPTITSGTNKALHLECLHANINVAGFVCTAVYFVDNFGNNASYFVYSNDYGNTWNAGGQILNSFLFSHTFRRLEISDCLAGSDVFVPYTWQLTQEGISYNGALGGDVTDIFELRGTDLPTGAWWSDHDIYMDPSDPAVLYTYGDGDLYRSLDGGETWDLILTTSDADVGDFYNTSPTFADGIPCGIGRCGTIRVITDTNSDYNLRWCIDAFTEDNPTFHGPRTGTGDITDTDVPGISLVHAAKNYLYGIKLVGAGSETAHAIFVVEHDRADTTNTDPLNWVGKGGSDRTDATTTGVPGRAEVFDIIQDWTSL